MAHVIIPVNNTDATVTKLAAEHSVRTIMGKLKIPRIEQIKYIPRGDRSNVSPLGNTDNALQLDTDKYLIVQYNETFDTDVIDSSASVMEHPPLFVNKAIGVVAVPLYRRVKLEMTISYRSTNYDDLTLWLNEYRSWKQNSVTSMYHDIAYNYTIPSALMEYLNQCYQLTESLAPYGNSLKTFMLSGFGSVGLNIRKNMIGTKERLVYNGVMERCLGIFTSEPDIVDATKEPPVSVISFTYVLRYERISSVKLIYQKYVHNQVIDLTILNRYFSHQPFFNQHTAQRTASQNIEDITSSQFNTTPQFIRIPGDDDGWVPNQTTRDMEVITITPIRVDPFNKKSIFSLNDLPELGYTQPLTDNIKGYYQSLLIPYVFFFYIEIFEVNSRTYKIPIEIKPDFNIQSKIDMDLRSRHYMQISLCMNLSKIDFSVLRHHPLLLKYFFNLYDPNIQLEVIGNGRYVTDRAILKAVNLINNTNKTKYPFYHQCFASIQARRIGHANV